MEVLETWMKDYDVRTYREFIHHNKTYRSPSSSLLQCGRINKDAEMRKRNYFQNGNSSLQCGRIHKDAEIYVLILGE